MAWWTEMRSLGQGPGQGFAHLHVRSGFSYGFGVATPAELATAASELGMGALALTDRDVLYGIPRLFEAASRYHSATWLTVGSPTGRSLAVSDRRASASQASAARRSFVGWTRSRLYVRGRYPRPFAVRRISPSELVAQHPARLS